MKKLLLLIGAAIALTAEIAVAARAPSAFLDSNPASLDTRVGTAFAVENQVLDSRTGSWADSNLRGLDTTNMGTRIVIH